MLITRKRDKLEYIPWIFDVALAVGILIVEGILHVLCFFLPIKSIWKHLFSGARKREEDPLDFDFVPLVTSHGYTPEEHFVQTKDGFVLCIHRVLPLRSDGTRSIQQPSKGVVFLQHGFMQCSESWVARGRGKTLVYDLVEEGYDVWLGNNRGGKYSYKHVTLSPQSDAYWNFCLDDFAMYDLPAMIDYVLEYTESKSLSYIGFSQGTAQAFAAFSSNPKLAKKINVFVAMAAATRVQSVQNPIVSAVAASRPRLVFLLLGRRSMLPETLFWRRILSHQAYAHAIDFFLDFLFGWKTLNINDDEKPTLYAYLYAFSSVKTLVHWFQITQSQNFQVFDDNIEVNQSEGYRAYVTPSYQLSRISCPMAIFYGGGDKLPEMTWLLTQLPEGTLIHKEESYEHLDFLWARDVNEKINKRIIEHINKFTPGVIPSSKSL